MESGLAGMMAVDTRLMRAATLLDTDPARAALEAAEILKECPGHPGAMLLLGTARRTSGSPEASAACFDELVAAQPNSAPVQFELGQTLAAQGRAAEALTALNRAVELEPNLAEAWRELAALHAANGDTLACDAAYARFTQLASPDQHVAEAYAARANHRLDAAKALLRQELALNSQDPAALRLLAEIAAEREDYVEAEQLCGLCLKIAPGYSRARRALGDVIQQHPTRE